MTDRSPDAGDFHHARLTRRSLLLGAGSLMLAGCASMPGQQPKPLPKPLPPARPAMYDAMPEELFDVPAVDVSQMAPEWWRREVAYETDERPGTLIVETGQKYLYHVRPNGRAMRYAIGVGRQGFSWQGRAIIAYKRVWPRWTPPDSMVARQPELEPYSIANGGMSPSATNPMGARGLYIHQNGRDTIYRVHGTHQPWTIGQSISSGCIRLINQDIIHLHDNVRDGSTIVVRHDTAPDLVAIAG